MFGNSLIQLAVAALAASSLVSAQPHGRRHAALHRREPVPDVVTIFSAVKTVCVDQHGNTIDPNSPRIHTSTVVVTVHRTRPTTTTTAAAIKITTSVPGDKLATLKNPDPTTTTSTSTTSTSTTSTSTSTTSTSTKAKVEAASTKTTSKEPAETTKSSSGSYTAGTYPAGGRSKPGIAYSPYNADNSCKTAEQVAVDVAVLKDFSPLRLYGVDCKQVQNVIAAAKQYGVKVFTGIYNIDKAAAELETLIQEVNGEWDSVHTVAIGNEVVNFGRKTASEFAGIINSSRARLRQADVGYNGPVVGVDTFVAILGNPAICEASDYVAANCHSFFDGGVVAEDSGKFLANMKIEMAKVCGSKEIVITEVGWPTAGNANGKAIPGLENQKAAISSVVKTQGNNVILFTAFDDLWKKDTALTFNAEQHWGVKDLSLS